MGEIKENYVQMYFLTHASKFYTAVTTVYGLTTELNVSTTHNIGSLMRADRLGTGAKHTLDTLDAWGP